MSLRIKNIVYTIVLLSAVFLVWKYRQTRQLPIITFSGKTMGPIVYKVTYYDQQNRQFRLQTDSLLKAFNHALSTYDPASEVSHFNRDSALAFHSPWFYPVLVASRKVYELSGGAYDPTVMPLVNAWGFGPDKTMKKDSAHIDSLKALVGFDRIHFDEHRVWKENANMQLDFSAAAKGYGVDVVVDFLEDRGVENYLVEIGGEVRVKGKNVGTGKPWQIGILHPDSEEINPHYMSIVALQDKAMATSGNYFNYYIEDGIKYSHTISPTTGYPIRSPLLSATVFANNCMEADALATAFMVMGHEKAITLLEHNPQYDAYLIFNNAQGNISTYLTAGMADFVEEVE